MCRAAQTDLLMRLKTEINAWDKVAERHPYSVYRRDMLPAYATARKDDPFTTSFGEGLPFRTYDRNQRARTAVAATRTMEQPFPRGYTGHVGGIRHVVGRARDQGPNPREIRAQPAPVAPELSWSPGSVMSGPPPAEERPFESRPRRDLWQAGERGNQLGDTGGGEGTVRPAHSLSQPFRGHPLRRAAERGDGVDAAARVSAARPADRPGASERRQRSEHSPAGRPEQPVRFDVAALL